jgi:hypothetical protein
MRGVKEQPESTAEWFSVIRDTERNQPIIYVSEDD